MRGLSAIGVVVPAHNEDALIASCLGALRSAAAQVSDLEVRLLVVLDSCTDTSALVCQKHDIPSLEVSALSAGKARGVGFTSVMASLLGSHELDRIWLASTDADSRVAPDWLAQQRALADSGADAVFGVVDVDWTGRPASVARRYDTLYSSVGPGHPHRHGASFGLRADRYLQVGGMPALTVGEDQALSDALEQLPDARVVASSAVRVTTSSRRTSRVEGGFATLLNSL